MMPARKLLVVFVFFYLIMGAAGVQAQDTFAFKSGIQVPVRILTQVSSNDFYPVQAIVDQPVLDSAGQEMIKAGTEVILMVSKTRARGSGRPGQVTIEPLRTTAANGKTVLLQGSVTVVGEDLHNKVVLGTVCGCVLLGLPGLLVLLIKGKPAYIHPGFLMTNIVVTSIE